MPYIYNASSNAGFISYKAAFFENFLVLITIIGTRNSLDEVGRLRMKNNEMIQYSQTAQFVFIILLKRKMFTP